MDKVSRLSQRLQLNKFKLSSLLDMTKGINNNLPIEELMAIYEEIVHAQLGIERLLLYARNETGWVPMLQYGKELDVMDIAPEELAAEHQEITVLTTQDDSALSHFDVLIPVYHNENPLAFLLIGDLDEEEAIAMSPTVKHMNFIQTLTNVLVVAVENRRLMKANIEQARMKREIELAADMQTMLVPSYLPTNEEVDIDALYFPHEQVGGDYYDYIKTPRGEHFFCIADVSGKGVAAAFLMANFQARMRAMVERDESLEELVHRLNSGVIEAAQGDRFITVFIGKYNADTRLLEYINAGHNPQLLIHKGETHWLKSGCVGLGMLDDIPSIKIGQVQLAESALMVTFTDGLVEMENAEDEEYGYDRVETSARKFPEGSMVEVNKSIIEDFDAFRSGMRAQDDIALLSVRFF